MELPDLDIGDLGSRLNQRAPRDDLMVAVPGHLDQVEGCQGFRVFKRQTLEVYFFAVLS